MTCSNKGRYLFEVYYKWEGNLQLALQCCAWALQMHWVLKDSL